MTIDRGIFDRNVASEKIRVDKIRADEAKLEQLKKRQLCEDLVVLSNVVALRRELRAEFESHHHVESRDA